MDSVRPMSQTNLLAATFRVQIVNATKTTGIKQCKSKRSDTNNENMLFSIAGVIINLHICARGASLLPASAIRQMFLLLAGGRPCASDLA